MRLVIADLNERGIFRPHDEIEGTGDTKNDTGLSNRLLCWELMKIINHLHDNKFEIVIDSNQNPEADGCVDLEDTTLQDIRLINFEHYLPISDEILQDIIDGKLKLDEGKSYYTDFTKRHIHDFSINYPTRFIRNLKFVHNDLNQQVKNIVNGCIGIHVRRGRGVRIHYDKSTIDLQTSFDLENSFRFTEGKWQTHYSGKFANEQLGKVKLKAKNTIDLDLFSGWDSKLLSEYVATKLLDMPAWKHYQFDFIGDDIYFEKIDMILDKNPKQKFYISHDLDYSFFKRWNRRYPKNLIFKEHFYDLLTRWEMKLELNTKNFLDLYALCNTRHIFTVPYSTWSELACDYNNKVGIDINSTSNEEILDRVYQKNLL